MQRSSSRQLKWQLEHTSCVACRACICRTAGSSSHRQQPCCQPSLATLLLKQAVSTSTAAQTRVSSAPQGSARMHSCQQCMKTAGNKDDDCKLCSTLLNIAHTSQGAKLAPPAAQQTAAMPHTCTRPCMQETMRHTRPEFPAQITSLYICTHYNKTLHHTHEQHTHTCPRATECSNADRTTTQATPVMMACSSMHCDCTTSVQFLNFPHTVRSKLSSPAACSSRH